MLSSRLLFSIKGRIGLILHLGRNWLPLRREIKVRPLRIRVMLWPRKLLRSCRFISWMRLISKSIGYLRRRSARTPRFLQTLMKLFYKSLKIRKNNSINTTKTLINSQKTNDRWCLEDIKHTKEDKQVTNNKIKMMVFYEFTKFKLVSINYKFEY